MGIDVATLSIEMKTRDCSRCGYSASAHVWGFALLARDGWGIAAATNPPGAAERAWICDSCDERETRGRNAIARRSGAPLARVSDQPRSLLRVLIVDEHPLLLRCMARLLGGCETTLTTSPRHALALLLAGGKFDVIVCDVMMPDVTGPELYARCFEHSPELARRFLFASSDPGSARGVIDEVALRVGASPAPLLIGKPVSQAGLVAAVLAVAGGVTHGSGTYELRLPASDNVGSTKLSSTKNALRGSSSR